MGKEEKDKVTTLAVWTRASIAKLKTARRSTILETVRNIIQTSRKLFDAIPYADAMLAAGATILVVSLTRYGFQRCRTATEIPLKYIRNGIPLRGCIVGVNDSDNVRFYHNRILSWGKPKIDKADYKNETINIRLAGIDAPEMGHFGGTVQPFAEEAKNWLTAYTLSRRAIVVVHRIDHYSRAVATVYVRRFGLFRKNVSLEMVRAGFAVVYTGTGAEYGGVEKELRSGEIRAKKQRLGMWQQASSNYISPAEYKRKLRLIDNKIRSARGMMLFPRYDSVEEIPQSYFKYQKELSGIVVSVSDGDGFRFYHQRLFSCSPPNIHRNDIATSTIKIRLAGIDAPEIAHDGDPFQPFAIEARDFLRKIVAGKKVILKLHSIDQYGRAVASAHVKRLWFFRTNLSLELVACGLASVYTAQGAQYGGVKNQLLAAETASRKEKKGIWSIEQSKYKSPGAYKLTVTSARLSRRGAQHNWPMTTVHSTLHQWRHWRTIVRNYRLQKELQRLGWAILWFATCALSMAIVQINGDATHARYILQPLLTGRDTFPAKLKIPAIYDLVFENLPNFLDHRFLNPDLMLHSFLIISVILAFFHWPARILVRRVRRYLWLYGSGYLLRMCTLAFTVLPPSDVNCIPLERSLGQTLVVAPKLLFGHVRSCTDKIFSGHTTVATLLLWFWNEARNEARDGFLSVWRIYPIVHFLLMVMTSILGRNHYTVDIVVSFIVNSLNYWIYRLLLSLTIMKYLSNVPLKETAEFTAIDIVHWCEGLDLIENEFISVSEMIELNIV